MGAGLPARDLLVSPQHRMLVEGAPAEMLFGEAEVLVAALHMTLIEGVDQLLPMGVRYLHLLFDAHEIIRAEGAWTESFLPADRSLQGMDGDQRAEIASLFPEMAEAGPQMAPARRSLKSHEARALLAA